MSVGRGDTVSAVRARHEQAVARTLEWADEAAERGQHATALEWLQTLEAIGDELSSEYQHKRERWRRALPGERAGTRTSVGATVPGEDAAL